MIKAPKGKCTVVINVSCRKCIPDTPVYRRLQEKALMIEDERDYYRDKYEELKARVQILEEEVSRFKL
jgi:hypothetical protein